MGSVAVIAGKLTIEEDDHPGFGRARPDRIGGDEPVDGGRQECDFALVQILPTSGTRSVG
jgi:hypothetical protein